MRLKQSIFALVAMLLCAFSANAQGGSVAKIGDTEYTTFADAMAAANATTGDVTIEVYDKVTLNTAFSGSYSSINFVGKDTDAEIYLDVQGYITATGKKVSFKDLTLSKSAGGYMTNAGFMNVAFGIYDVTEVAYTKCVFANGAYASSGNVTFNDCTFYRSHDKYGLWAYGNVDVAVEGCTFADYRGIKMYAEGAAKTVDLTVKNTDFSAVTDKPAIVLTYGESVVLEGNTYSSTGTFELDLDGAPNRTAVTSDVAPTCKNDNGTCGVLVDGKIYTTVAQAAAVAAEGSNVTLLYSTTDAVEFAEGVNLTLANGVIADNVTVATSGVAKVGENVFTTVLEALQYAVDNNAAELKILCDVREKMTTDFYLNINADLTITADAPVKVEFYNDGTTYDFVVGSTNNNKLTIGENVHFDLVDRVIWLGYWGNNVTVFVNGYLGGYQIWHGANTVVNGTLDSHGEAFVMRRDATLTANEGAKVNANYFQIYSGHIVAENATITAGLVWVNNNHDYGIEGTVSFELDNTEFTSNGEVKIYAGEGKIVSVTLENSSLFDAKGVVTLGDNVKVVADATSSIQDANGPVVIPVAKVNGVEYADIQEAFKAATEGCTIDILADVTVDYYWDCRNTGSKFFVPVTINGNDHTLKFTNVVYDGGNHFAAFRFEADATVNNLTVDMTEAQSGFNGRFRAISSKANLTVNGCTFIGNGSANNTRAIIFGEGAGSNAANLAISVANSNFEGWKRGITDNENGQDVKSVTVTGNTLKDAAVYVSANETVTFTGNTVEGAYVNINSYTTGNTLDVTATGNTLEANTGDACNSIKAGGTVDAQGEFVVPAKGSNSFAYTKEENGYVRVWGEGGGNAKESYELKLYSGETLIATTKLNNVDNVINGDVYVTWNFYYPQSNDEYWTTTWEEGHPNSAAQPTEVELYIDGTLVATTAAKMSGADDVAPVVWRNLGGVAIADLLGEGTAENPYLIETLKDLKFFRDDVNTYTQDGSNQYKGKYVKLTADIDLAGENWEPIGKNSNGDHQNFLGTFYGEKADGTKPTISNLYINADGDHLGFFARVGSYDEGLTPTVKNIKFNNVDVSSNTTNSHSGSYVAGVIANAGGNSVVSGIEVTGDVYVVGYGYIGGIVGHGYPDIDNCHVAANDGSYIHSHYWCVGGIIGYAGEGGTPITNSSVSGVDIWSAYGGAAAIAGLLNDGNKLENVSASNVDITSSSDYCMGYIAGNGIGSTMTGISIENVTATANGNPITPTDAVAKVNDAIYFSLEAALEAVQAGDEIVLLADVTEDVTLPAGVTFNGNGKTVSGEVWAAGNLTFVGHTKATNFNAGYNQPVITIGEGACLELTGTGRMVIGHGATFNITGSIEDAKTADVAALTPSLIIPGASFTGAGVTFNVTNAYIKATAYCSSKNNNANGTFNFNVTNSVWEQGNTLVFSAPTNSMDPTFNLNLVNSVLNSTSHLVFAVTKGEIVIDNSNVNVGTSRQIENRSTMTIKNGSVVNGAVATSQNAKNPGTLIVEDATYAVTGEFSGSDLGTGTLIVNKGATVSAGSITKANIKIDATGMAAGDEVNLTANLSNLVGTIEVVNNDNLDASIVDGKIVLVAVIKPVAKIGEQGYETLAAALTAAQDGDVVTLVWADGDAPIAMNGSVFGKNVTITGTATVDWSKGFLFVGRGGEGNATVTFDGANLTSASDQASTGIHVSGREKGTNNKYDGTLVIKNSTIELDYLINKNTMSLDNSTLTVKNGFSIGGRPASETESGADATATISLANNSKVIVNNHNGMGLGYEAIGVMNIDATSTFEATQAFLVTAKGTMNVAAGGAVSVNGTLTVNGTLVSAGNIAATIAAGDNATIEISGGVYTQDVNEWCVDGYAALPDLNGNYVVGVKPTATVNNLGMTTVAAGDYSIWNGSFDQNTEDDGDMPLSFVMQFLADQDAEDMATSPFADWYGDFVITFTGIESGSFTADGCYLAGHYGSFGWVKVPVDGMTINEGARYPVMLGVGMGQKYDYICSSVEDFKCALYLTPEILEANPNIQVKLELGVVDNSKGSDAAASALINNDKVYSVTEYTYNADDFVVEKDPEVVDGKIEFVDGEFNSYTNDTDIENVEITYKRTIDSDWNALYVPFAIPASELLADFDIAYINDVRETDADDDGELDGWQMELIKIKKETAVLRANHPYFVRSKSADYTENNLSLTLTTTLYKATVAEVNCSSMYSTYTIKGLNELRASTEFGDADRVLGYDNGETTWGKMADGYSLKPFRFYLTITNHDGSPVVSSSAQMSIVVRGEDGTTGIDGIYGDENGETVIFDLYGRRVLEPEKGNIYIINGKKVLVK